MKNLLQIPSTIKRYRLSKNTYILLGILLIGIILRFFNTPDRFGFDRDPTRDALITLYGIQHLAFPLIGPSSGLAPFSFGPWYYYELILFHLIVPLKFAAFYFIPVNSLLIIPLMYLIGKEVKNTTVGLFAAAFSALSPGQMDLTNALSNPSLITPHAAFSVLFFLLYLNKKGSLVKTVLWGLVMGIGINHHFQMIPLLVLPAVAFLPSFRTSIKHILVFAGGLFVAFIPLLIFNFQTNWHTVRGFLQMLNGGEYVPNSWKIYLGQFWPNFMTYLTGFPGMIALLLLASIIAIQIFMVYKRELSSSYLFLILSFGVIVIFLRYYDGPREFYYVAFLQPFVFIITAMSLWKLWSVRLGKVIVPLLLLVALGIIFPIDIHKAHTREDNVNSRLAAEKIASLYPRSTFQIYSCGISRIEMAQGVAFYLETSERLDDSGKNIALKDTSGKCSLPGFQDIQGTKFVDVSRVPRNELKALGWKIISSETVYKETVDWWY